MDIVYPNKQYGGMYSLGPLIIYNLVNKRKDWYCERVFLDYGKVKSALVGFSLQYEGDFYNALKMRGKGLNFAGGPVVEMYYEKLIKYFDFLILGDVEAVLPSVLDEYEKGVPGFIERVSKIQGVYTGEKVSRGVIGDIDTFYPIYQPFPKEITKEFVFGKCFMLEIERGCPFDCKFCALRRFYPSVRFRKLSAIKKVIDEGLKVNKVSRVVIYSPSFAHPDREEILKYLISKKVRVSVPSIRAELMDKDTLILLKKCGLESLTIAPECGQTLRMKIGKKVSDDQYFRFIKFCNETGFKKLKVYLMIGLPGMAKMDMEEMVKFMLDLKKRFHGTIYLSMNYFVPKPGCEFEDYVLEKKKMKEMGKFVDRSLVALKIKRPSISSAIREWKFLKS
jgi:radical SAM superfamily enzyme YgiQ (UPF0313 family)